MEPLRQMKAYDWACLAAPASLLAASTYNDELTLAMAFYEPAISKSMVECFLNR